MAKKPRANSHDKTTRNIIIGFCTIILIVGAVLMWNNRALSYAGTVDGERMPISHLQFYQNQAWRQLTWDWGVNPHDPWTVELALQIGFDNLVEFNVVVNRAAEFGLSLADVDAQQVEDRIAEYRMFHDMDDEIIRTLGFSSASYRRFIEMRILYDMVQEHVGNLLVVTEDALAAAYEQHLEDSFLFLTEVSVHVIETHTREQAEGMLAQIMEGADFVDLMRASSISYDPNNQQIGPDGEIIESINVLFTSLDREEDLEHIMMIYSMEEGEMSDILELSNGHFAIFEVVDVNPVIEDFEAFEEAVRNNHEAQWRFDYFRERLDAWMENVEVVRNTRVVGEGFEE